MNYTRRQRIRKRNRSVVCSKRNNYRKQDDLIDLINNIQRSGRYRNLEKLPYYIDEAKEEIIRVIQVSEELQELGALKRYLFGLCNEYGDIFFKLPHPMDKPYDEDNEEPWKEYQDFYLKLRKFLLFLCSHTQQKFPSNKILYFAKQVELSRFIGFEVRIKDRDSTALRKVYRGLLKKEYIDKCGLQNFRRCFEGKTFSTQIGWILIKNRKGTGQNQLNYFIKVLTDKDNNYVKSASKKWIRASNIFYILDAEANTKIPIDENILRVRPLEYKDPYIDKLLKNLA